MKIWDNTTPVLQDRRVKIVLYDKHMKWEIAQSTLENYTLIFYAIYILLMYVLHLKWFFSVLIRTLFSY